MMHLDFDQSSFLLNINQPERNTKFQIKNKNQNPNPAKHLDDDETI